MDRGAGAGNGGDCVEIADVGTAVPVRDSERPADGFLTVDAGQWAAFVRMAARGRGGPRLPTSGGRGPGGTSRATSRVPPTAASDPCGRTATSPRRSSRPGTAARSCRS
ncbi:DUF397 domain-containing protein [Streptomyces sp. NPDC057052]|uniref:DUF397 domain-containing protein n=1 Tax=Streptomyces sp. NPDC057052 TaxID=3346010 RepID=UPI0036359EEE